MIRLELPPAVLARLRWRAGSPGDRTSRRRSIGDRLYRTGAAVRATWNRLACDAREFMRLDRRVERIDVACFADHCEDMMRLLCRAAKEGIRPDTESRYTDSRAWLLRHYRQVRTDLQPYWSNGNRPAAHDPFDTLFRHASAARAIHSPDAVTGMARAQAALDAYLARQ